MPRRGRSRPRATSTGPRVDLGAGDSQGFTALWQYAVDAAIASASHPLAFPSVLLDRTAYRSEYVDREITNLPDGDELELWYADGGMLDRQPLGRCLDLVAEKDKEDPRGDKRMVVLVRTDCDSAPEGSDPAWTGAADAPDWGETLTRTLRMVTTHSLFEDLRRAGKINDQIERTDALAETLAAAVSANRENVLEALGASPDDQTRGAAEAEAQGRRRPGAQGRRGHLGGRRPQR